MFTEQISDSQRLAVLISLRGLVCCEHDVCVGVKDMSMWGCCVCVCVFVSLCIGGGIKQDCMVRRGPRSSNIEGW